MALALREKIFRVAFNQFSEVGAVRMRTLLEAFGSIEAAWHAKATQLTGLPRFSERLSENLVTFCRTHDPEALYHQVMAKGIQVQFLGEPDYPELLAQIYDPPFVLYWRGLPAAWAQLHRCVAIVGTRKASPYGLMIARRLAVKLSGADVAIVSGMALGIDGAAHQAALDSGGLTVAVLGSGVDVPSPPSHRKLYEQICAQGLVISEFPPGQPPQKGTFPMRNRIVSGLSQGLIVVEAGHKSGTLITVDCANEQGREVFAVPGPITSHQSQGTNALIQQGAHLLTHPDEVLEQLGWLVKAPKALSETLLPLPAAEIPLAISLTKSEEHVYVLLSEQPQHIDVLVNTLAGQSPQEAQQLSGILTLLELKGLAQQLPGKLYRKKS